MSAEPLLGRKQLEELTGLSRNTIAKMLTDPAVWNVPGGTKQIAGQYFLTVTFYNRWLAGRDLARRPQKPKTTHA